MRINAYDPETVAENLSKTDHRRVIGGMWEVIGRLQLDYLKAQGLTPASTLMDVGCGSLRGGVHFVPFLEPGHYFGIDLNQSLLDAGYGIEIAQLGLQERLPRENLHASPDFDFTPFPVAFDFALAQSVFTHLPANHIRLCLARLAPKMAAQGRFFATFFIVDDAHPFGQSQSHQGGITSFDAKDPYHYRFRDIEIMSAGFGWQAVLHGEWGHPRGQQMVEFRRTERSP